MVAICFVAKVLRVFLLAIQSHIYSFASRFFLQTHATSYSFFSTLLYSVKEKGGKPDRKPQPLPYGLRNPYRNLKSGELSRLCPETSRNLYLHEFGFSTCGLCCMGVPRCRLFGSLCHIKTDFFDPKLKNSLH